MAERAVRVEAEEKEKTEAAARREATAETVLYRAKLDEALERSVEVETLYNQISEQMKEMKEEVTATGPMPAPVPVPVPRAVLMLITVRYMYPTLVLAPEPYL